VKSKSWAAGIALAAAALGSTVLTTQPAAAAGTDPCLAPGYARTAWGDVGAAGWYRNASYNVGYVNSSPWGSSTGVDHNMQWEMTYQSSTRTARFCVRNLKPIGRTSLAISTEMIEPSGNRHATNSEPADPVPAGAGWINLSSSNLPAGGTYRVYFGDFWNGGNTYGWSNVVLRSYRA
jgi:hypothetical protein